MNALIEFIDLLACSPVFFLISAFLTRFKVQLVLRLLLADSPAQKTVIQKVSTFSKFFQIFFRLMGCNGTSVRITVILKASPGYSACETFDRVVSNVIHTYLLRSCAAAPFNCAPNKGLLMLKSTRPDSHDLRHVYHILLTVGTVTNPIK